MKTNPFHAKQSEAIRAAYGREGFGFFMEQGTGKTWCVLSDAERMYAGGHIEGLLVFAPSGVHTNWVRVEVPKHLDENSYVAVEYRSSDGVIAARKRDAALFTPRRDGAAPRLRVLAMNYEALRSKKGFAYARKFLQTLPSMMVLDESHRIKNPHSLTTRKIFDLQPFARFRRVATGTNITNSPLDLFAQMQFVEDGCLGTSSYRAFAAEYAVLLDENDAMFKKMMERNQRIKRAIIVARDGNGAPRFRNLARLQELVFAHSFHTTKAECLDLPEKIYTQRYFDLSTEQQRIYDVMKSEARLVIEDMDIIEPSTKLGAISKLQQITSGFAIRKIAAESIGGKSRRETVVFIDDPAANPRLSALRQEIEDTEGKIIIWATFKEEVAGIAKMLREMGVSFVEYHGGIDKKARPAIIDEFQNGSPRCFVATRETGGIGITLTAAETTIYYSNSYNLGDRLQSEDRNHRIGTVNHVRYVDLIAKGTLDEAMVFALQRKEDVATLVMRGDFSL